MSSILSKLINLAGNITGTLPAANGGLATDASAFSGVVKASAGAFSAATVVNADVSGAAAIDGSKIVTATASVAGVVDTGTQTFAGNKTFNGTTSLGASGVSTVQNIIRNNTTTTTPAVIVLNGDTTSSSDGTYPLEIRKGSTTSTTSQTFVLFTVNAGATNSGKITSNGANAATFTSTSDQNTKENIVDLPPQLENIMRLKPREFDYRAGLDGISQGHQVGFIAQELAEVFPDAVSMGRDGWLQITGWNKQEAVLVRALQELKAQFDAYVAARP